MAKGYPKTNRDKLSTTVGDATHAEYDKLSSIRSGGGHDLSKEQGGQK